MLNISYVIELNKEEIDKVYDVRGGHSYYSPWVVEKPSYTTGCRNTRTW